MDEKQTRWEKLKNRSDWHFDNLKPAEQGKDSFTHICRFIADWSDVIAEYDPKAWPSYYNNPKQITKESTINSATTNLESFYGISNVKNDLFNKVAEWLGIELDTVKISYHNQKTGQMCVEHFDNFLMFRTDNKDNDLDSKPSNPESMRRFAIMLSDWQLGQVFMLGNGLFHQWRAGDCITWEWQDIPHATCNMGWEDRPMLQITGYTTDRTKKVLANASKDLEINIEANS